MLTDADGYRMKLFPSFKRQTIDISNPVIEGLNQPLPIEELLTQYQPTIDTVFGLLSMDRISFGHHFQEFIKSLLHTLQCIPAVKYKRYCRPYGLADLCLLAGINALKLRRGLVLPPGTRTDLVDAQRNQWSFVIFSVAVMATIRDSLNDCLIEISDKGHSFKRWDAMHLGLGDVGYFRFKSAHSNDSSYAIACANILGNRWITPETLTWLAVDNTVISEWSAGISGHHALCRYVVKFMQLATCCPSLVVQTEVVDPASKSNDVKVKSLATETQNPVFGSIAKEPFFDWIYEQIEQGTLVMNTSNSLIHVVEEGLFAVTPTLYSRYQKLTGCSDQSLADIKLLVQDHCLTVRYEAYGRTLEGFRFDSNDELIDGMFVNDELVIL